MATSRGKRKVNTVVGKRTGYVYGNVLTSEEVVRRMHEPRTVVDENVQRNRARAKKMGFRDVFFLTIASAAVVIMLVSYLQMQSELTYKAKYIAKREIELSNLKLSNDEELNRIESSINLEEIKRIAVEELGMNYAKTGQVVTISDEGSDYVRQIASIPNN